MIFKKIVKHGKVHNWSFFKIYYGEMHRLIYKKVNSFACIFVILNCQFFQMTLAEYAL